MKVGPPNYRGAVLTSTEAERAVVGQPFTLWIMRFGAGGGEQETEEFSSLDQMFDQGWRID